MGAVLRDRRTALLALIADSELNTAAVARRAGKTERAVAYMLETLKKDGCARARAGQGLAPGKPQKLWKATGKPVPERPTATPKRRYAQRSKEEPQFDCSGLLSVWR